MRDHQLARPPDPKWSGFFGSVPAGLMVVRNIGLWVLLYIQEIYNCYDHFLCPDHIQILD